GLPESGRDLYRRRSYRSRPNAVPVAEGNSDTGRITNSIESWSSALSSPGDELSTVAGFDKGERPFILIGFPLIGAVLGWCIRPLATWASDIDPLPFGRVIDLIAGWNKIGRASCRERVESSVGGAAQRE